MRFDPLIVHFFLYSSFQLDSKSFLIFLMAYLKLSPMSIDSPSFTADLAMRSVFSLMLMPLWTGTQTSYSFSTSKFSIALCIS